MLGVYNKFGFFFLKILNMFKQAIYKHDWESAWLKGEHVTEPKYKEEVYRRWKWGQVTQEECRGIAQACREKPKLRWIRSW